VTLSIPGEVSSPALYVGLHGDVGALLYVSVEAGQEFSKNTDAAPDGEPFLYMYQTQAEEFPPDSEIPIDLVRRAAHHFVETLGKLADVTWEEWDRAGNEGESDYGDLL
jgi:immunity protein Imm1 of predicted polymorphic toxin system